MVSSVVFSVVAAVLIQTVYGQCGSSYIPQLPVAPISTGGCGCGGNGVNYAPVVSAGCGNNVALSNGYGSNLIGQNAYSSGLSSSIAYPESVLSISSGSYTTPNGLQIVAENLEIGGTVGVYGAMPFVGAVTLNGAAPTAGQAIVSYNSAPGVAISESGCGLGLAGNGAYGNVGNNVGIIGNGYGIGNGVGLGNGVGCGNSYLGGSSGLIRNNVVASNAGYSLGGCGCQ